MDKKTGEDQGFSGEVRRKGNNHSRKDINHWKNWYLSKLEAIDQGEKEAIELYRWFVLSTADRISEQKGLTELESREDILESFSYEVTGKRIGYFLQERPSVGQVVKLVKKLTLKRLGTWFNLLIRQREAFEVHLQGFIIERDEEGGISDFGIIQTEWSLPLCPPNPYDHDPEACLLKMEELEKVKELPLRIGRYPTKKASLMERISKIQLSGEEVGPIHREILGVKTAKQLTQSKSQTFGCAQKIFARIFPDLNEKQKIFKSQRGKKWKIRRSTRKERRELFRTPLSDDMKPSPVKILRVADIFNSTSDK
jgi:hypothetical protein